MSKKEGFLIALVLVLGGWYVVFFSGWFGPKIIQVEHSVRAQRDAYGPGGRRVDRPGTQVLGNVSFSLRAKYQITSLKVVAVADAFTNKFPHALWQLASKTGSKPVDSLAYGLSVPGMSAPSPGLSPDPLAPGVEYRLFLEAGSWKGTHDFNIPLPARAAR